MVWGVLLWSVQDDLREDQLTFCQSSLRGVLSCLDNSTESLTLFRLSAMQYHLWFPFQDLPDFLEKVLASCDIKWTQHDKPPSRDGLIRGRCWRPYSHLCSWGLLMRKIIITRRINISDRMRPQSPRRFYFGATRDILRHPFLHRAR